MSGFSFGAPASTSGSTGSSLFGTAGGGNTGGSLFGNSAAGTGTGSAGFSFGNFGATPTSSAGEEKKSLFGSTTDNKPTGNIFGQPAAGSTGGTSGGFSFGKPAENQISQPAASPFLGFGTPAKPTDSTGGGTTSLFGSTTPAGSGNNLFSFSNPSTTPAGPPPTTSAFGASTGGASIFGQTKPAQPASSQSGGFSFGQPATATAMNPPPSQPPSAGGLFGNTQPAGGLFGSKPAASGGFSFGAPAKPAEKPADNPITAPPANTDAPKPNFSFGQPTPTTGTGTTSSTTTSSLFPSSSATASGNPSLFGSTPTQSTTPTPAKPLFGAAPASATGSSMFTKPANATTTTTTSAPAFSFPSTTAQAPSAPTTSASTAPKLSFGGLGATTPSSAPTPSLFGQSTTSTTPAPAASLFGPPAASNTNNPTPAAPSTTASVPASNLFSFGKPTSAAPPSTAATASSTAAPAGFTTTATAPATGLGASTLGASVAGPTPPAQSRLRNKTMDEILTRWASDLTKYTKDFKKQAETVAQWDQLIVDNSMKIDKLYIKTRTCEKQTMSVEMQLAAIENQQNELDSWLTKYEGEVDEMLAKDNTTAAELGGPDQERERTYKLAEKLGERLDDMGRDLEGLVEEVNAANASLSKNGKSDEPITQIVRILNSHLSQLQVIDQGTAVLQTKVAEAQKALGGMNLLNGGASNDGKAAVEDFYRSYMGRR